MFSSASTSTAVGVLDTLCGSPGRVIAYLLTGKTPVALNLEVVLRGVIGHGVRVRVG